MLFLTILGVISAVLLYAIAARVNRPFVNRLFWCLGFIAWCIMAAFALPLLGARLSYLASTLL